MELGETLIPNKYKELLMLAVHAQTHGRYCTLVHTEAVDEDRFAEQLTRIGEHLSS